MSYSAPTPFSLPRTSHDLCTIYRDGFSCQVNFGKYRITRDGRGCVEYGARTGLRSQWDECTGTGVRMGKATKAVWAKGPREKTVGFGPSRYGQKGDGSFSYCLADKTNLGRHPGPSSGAGAQPIMSSDRAPTWQTGTNRILEETKVGGQVGKKSERGRKRALGMGRAVISLEYSILSADHVRGCSRLGLIYWFLF